MMFPLEVWIDAVTDEHYVMDQFGNRFMLPRVMRQRPEPAVGEHWITDRSLGRMSLAAIIHDPGSPLSVGGGGGTGDGTDEVWIGASEPDPPTELWFDTDAVPASATSAGSYVHDQAVASATWTITHSLGFYPNVTVISSAGSEVEGAISYTDANVMSIALSAAQRQGVSELGNAVAKQFLIPIDLAKNELQKRSCRTSVPRRRHPSRASSTSTRPAAITRSTGTTAPPGWRRKPPAR
jgi:hypothetical protein